MAQNITLLGASYSNVPAVQLPKTGGGVARFDDASVTTATASDVASGKIFLAANGTITTGTNSGGGGGDNTFIVTLSFDSTDEMWKPDCTYAEIVAAYSQGREVVAKSDTAWTTADISTSPIPYNYVEFYVFFWSDTYNTYIFDVYDLFSDETYEWVTNEGLITPWFETVSKTYTPTESQQTETVTYNTSQHYNGLEQVNVTVNAISPTYVGSGITRRSSSDLTASGATVTVPSGYYSAQATKSVTSGTAGTPTATKGTVSNHTVTVTPSVTNTTGYITGSTKTGTAVSVSASELVSGSETKTQNGTYDVTNLAEIVVNVSGGGTSKNAQVAQSTTRATTSSYTEVISLTCTKAGTYNVYWSTFRSSTSGTWGSQLYLGSTAYGTAQTESWSNHIQNIHLSNVSISANQKVSVRVRTRGNNYYGYVGTLTIIEA